MYYARDILTAESLVSLDYNAIDLSMISILRRYVTSRPRFSLVTSLAQVGYTFTIHFCSSIQVIKALGKRQARLISYTTFAPIHVSPFSIHSRKSQHRSANHIAQAF